MRRCGSTGDDLARKLHFVVSSLKARLTEQALSLGFDRVGVARATRLDRDAAQLDTFLAAGRHGEMHYLEQTREVRADPRHEAMLAGARSIVVLATAYARSEPLKGPRPGRVARYAQGRDYHNVLTKRAQKLARCLREAGHATRVSVDTLPVLERAWAQRAGVGFIGKNCCVIVPGLGSHVLLSALITSAELEADEPMRERCGRCRACLDACPTNAFLDARIMDARRCISYLTIEQRGPIPEGLREGVGTWLFGCDACQDVCPFNATRPLDAQRTEPFAAHPRWDAYEASDLLAFDENAFRTYARGSPISRPGRAGMARNAAIVLGNSGAKRHLPVLDSAAQTHDSEVVREAARWAAAHIRTRAD